MDEIELNIDKWKKFIRDRITQLRLNANISEYQMSLELGQNKGYIQGISSGKAMPSMSGFLNICDYFGVTPLEFFDPEIKEASPIRNINEKLKRMTPDDLALLDEVLGRFLR